MKRFVIGVAALLVVVLPTTASAATTLTWVAGSGLGSDAVPCAGAEHWLLSDATQVSSASILVGGTTYAMQQDNGNQWSADTDAPIVVGDVAVATYEGDGTPTLSLGSCTAASSPTPTPTPSPTDPPGGVPRPRGWRRCRQRQRYEWEWRVVSEWIRVDDLAHGARLRTRGHLGGRAERQEWRGPPGSRPATEASRGGAQLDRRAVRDRGTRAGDRRQQHHERAAGSPQAAAAVGDRGPGDHRLVHRRSRETQTLARVRLIATRRARLATSRRARA